MSGFVFIRDAHGHPLMPTSSAYARTLLRRGKAVLFPHPAFTIVQLSSVILEPVLRPVLLVIKLRYTTVDFVALIVQTRSPPSFLTGVIELQQGSLGLGQSHRRRRQQRLQVFSTIRPSYSARMIIDTIDVLRHLLPVSHCMFLVPSATSSAGSWWQQAVMRLIAQQLPSQLKGIALLSWDWESRQEHKQDLVNLFIDVLPQADLQPPQFIACSMPLGQSRFQKRNLLHLADPQGEDYNKQMQQEAEHSRRFGRLGTIRHHGRPFTGIVYTISGSQQTVLKAPTGMGKRGVMWQYVPVPVQTPIHFWESSSVMLVPIGGIQR